MRVVVEAAIHPTESEGKVREAALRFLPDAKVEVDTHRLVAHGTDLHPLRQRVWELRIIDTFRAKVQHGIATDGRSVRFELSKQAALAGKVSFPPRPHVLGDLAWTVVLEDGDPWPDAERLSWWLAPETKDGEIVGPIDP